MKNSTKSQPSFKKSIAINTFSGIRLTQQTQNANVFTRKTLLVKLFSNHAVNLANCRVKNSDDQSISHVKSSGSRM